MKYLLKGQLKTKYNKIINHYLVSVAFYDVMVSFLGNRTYIFYEFILFVYILCNNDT